MKHALAAVLWCLAILSGIVGTASGAYVDATSKNRVGVSEQTPDIHTYKLGSLEQEPQRGDTIIGYDSATGVVFYVRQNPWTHFDPHGLWLMEKAPSWYQKATSMPGGTFIVPGAIVVSAVDSVADPAIEGKGAYTSERNAGRSVASSVGFGAAVGVSRATGMLDVGEGVSGEGISFSSDGNVTFSQLSDSERTGKLIEGGVKMAGTATLIVGGTSAVVNKAKGGKGVSPAQSAQEVTAPKSPPSGPTVGELRGTGQKDAHHIIQDAAVRDVPGYNTNSAPGVPLKGPSTAVDSPHYNATQVQRQAGGGTYGAERRIGYKSMRRGGLSPESARANIERADAYFETLGVDKTTPLRVPGNRH